MAVLAVDDELLNRKLIQQLLAPLAEVDLDLACDGAEAQTKLESRAYDLLLFDLMMPGIDGHGLTAWARRQPAHKEVPIMVLTAVADKASLLKAFEAGAVDYVTKPFHGPELVCRVRAQLKQRQVQRRMEDYANQLNLQILQGMKTEEEMRRAQNALTEANKALAEWAHKDALTGLWNRRKAWDLMEYEAGRSHRRQRTIGVALFDLDKFKGINDTLGHDVGDQVLKKAAGLLSGPLRRGDILIRWGGEEFLAVFPETNLEGTVAAAEKLRAAVEGGDWNLPDGTRVTVSGGVSLKTTLDEWDVVLKQADIALYRSKESGRNRITVH